MTAQAASLVTASLAQAGDLLVDWSPLFAVALGLPVLAFIVFLVRDLMQG